MNPIALPRSGRRPHLLSAHRLLTVGLTGMVLLGVAWATEATAPSLTLSTGLSAPSVPSVAMGERTPTPRRLEHLSDVIAAAWYTEPRIHEAIDVAAASGYDIQAALTGYYPFASVGARQTDDGRTSTSVRFIQPLWNGGLTSAEVEGARQAEQAALAEIDLARLEVAGEVINAYFELLAAETQVEQWDRQVNTLEGLVRVIQRRADEGVAPDADVQTAVSRLRQAEAGREMSRAAGESQRAELARLTGQDVGLPQWPAMTSPLASQSLEMDNVDRLVDQHPQSTVAAALIRQQRAEERRQRAALWPELQLQYRVDVEGVRSSEADGALLVLEYQTGNGLRGLRGAQAEAERSRAAGQRLVQARREITAKLRVSRAELISAIAQRRTQAAAVAATDVLLDSFLRQFEVGRKSWVEVLNASREANDTRLQAIAAERQYWVASARLALERLEWDRLLDRMPPAADDLPPTTGDEEPLP